MNNTYEAAEVVEIGQAHDLILGEKTEPFDDNAGGIPPDQLPKAFAQFDE